MKNLIGVDYDKMHQISAHFAVVHETSLARILIEANRLAEELNIVELGNVKPSGCHEDIDSTMTNGRMTADENTNKCSEMELTIPRRDIIKKSVVERLENCRARMTPAAATALLLQEVLNFKPVKHY